MATSGDVRCGMIDFQKNKWMALERSGKAFPTNFVDNCPLSSLVEHT